MPALPVRNCRQTIPGAASPLYEQGSRVAGRRCKRWASYHGCRGRATFYPEMRVESRAGNLRGKFTGESLC